MSRPHEIITPPAVEPIKRSKRRRASLAARAGAHRRTNTPPPKDGPRRSTRPQEVPWDRIKAAPSCYDSTCAAYAEQLGDGAEVWRLVLGVKLPKGLANTLRIDAPSSVYNIPLVPDGLGRAHRANIRAAFLMRNPQRPEALLIIKGPDPQAALELVALFDPQRAVDLAQLVSAQQGVTLTLTQATPSTLPSSVHVLFGPGHPDADTLTQQLAQRPDLTRASLLERAMDRHLSAEDETQGLEWGDLGPVTLDEL